MLKIQVLFKKICYFKQNFQKTEFYIWSCTISNSTQYYIHKENKNVEIWASKQNLYAKKELHEL